VRSYKAVTNCDFLILSYEICCIVQTTSVTNQNYFGSSVLVPLKIDIFIVFSMLNGGGGYGGIGVGV